METFNSAAKVSEIDLALCRATLYSALALGFRQPTQKTVTRIGAANNVAALVEAAAVLDCDRGASIVAAAQRLAVAEHFSPTELLESFQRLFGHTARGAVPPYETEYGTEALFQQPQEMGDLMGFYSAFGLTLNTAMHERPDHISCECEFACFLALKEAYALEHSEPVMLEETRNATRLFLRDHMGRFAPAFTSKLARADRGGFYGALAELCARLVRRDCDQFSVPLGTPGLSLRPAQGDEVPTACGSGAQCSAMPGCSVEEEL